MLKINRRALAAGSAALALALSVAPGGTNAQDAKKTVSGVLRPPFCWVVDL